MSPARKGARTEPPEVSGPATAVPPAGSVRARPGVAGDAPVGAVTVADWSRAAVGPGAAADVGGTGWDDAPPSGRTRAGVDAVRGGGKAGVGGVSVGARNALSGVASPVDAGPAVGGVATAPSWERGAAWVPAPSAPPPAARSPFAGGVPVVGRERLLLRADLEDTAVTSAPER